jgi:hypothetical protein
VKRLRLVDEMLSSLWQGDCVLLNDLFFSALGAADLSSQVVIWRH